MSLWRPRRAFTFVEILAVLAIIALVVGLLLAAVQKVRGAATRAKCQNNLHQLGLAFHHFHATTGRLPPGHRSPANHEQLPYTGWTLSLLPYLGHDAIFLEAHQAFQTSAWPFQQPPHYHIATVIGAYTCPADQRIQHAQRANRSGYAVAFTSYLGISGQNYHTHDGILYQDSTTRLAEIMDGTSNTLLIGERPPSADYQLGWWYAGYGQRGTGSADLILGVREENIQTITSGSPCGAGAYSYRDGHWDDPCSVFHFWSLHSGGANFLFADGSVRVLPYTANDLIPALASRAGGEPSIFP